MTPVLDAAALVALLQGEPGGPEVAGLLDGGGCQVSAVNLVEVVDRVSRGVRLAPHLVASAVAGLMDDGLEAVPCDHRIGLRAGTIRAQHYDKATMPVSLADCVALATTEQAEGTLITSDARLVELAERIAVAVHPIVNSAGRRPAQG